VNYKEKIVFKQAEVYSKDYCPNCVEAIALLVSFNIEVELFKVQASSDPSKNLVTKEELLARIPTARSVPQVFLDGVYVGGLDALQKKLTIEQ
jgi:glutaredoxin